MVPPHIMTGSIAESMIGSMGDLGFTMTSQYFSMRLLIRPHHTSWLDPWLDPWRIYWWLRIYLDILLLYYAFTNMVPPHIVFASMTGSMIGSMGDLVFTSGPTTHRDCIHDWIHDWIYVWLSIYEWYHHTSWLHPWLDPWLDLWVTYDLLVVPPHIMTGSMIGTMIGSMSDLGITMTS